MTESSPVDVKEYQEKNRQFPAHSTLDQFFDHEQFEAYRMIGYAAGTAAAEVHNRLTQDADTPDNPASS